MSEVTPVPDKTMAIDRAVTVYEQLILEAVVEDHEVALHGLMWAYEIALQDRYNHKKI